MACLCLTPYFSLLFIIEHIFVNLLKKQLKMPDIQVLELFQFYLDSHRANRTTDLFLI